MLSKKNTSTNFFLHFRNSIGNKLFFKQCTKIFIKKMHEALLKEKRFKSIPEQNKAPV